MIVIGWKDFLLRIKHVSFKWSWKVLRMTNYSNFTWYLKYFYLKCYNPENKFKTISASLYSNQNVYQVFKISLCLGLFRKVRFWIYIFLIPFKKFVLNYSKLNFIFLFIFFLRIFVYFLFFLYRFKQNMWTCYRKIVVIVCSLLSFFTAIFDRIKFYFTLWCAK